MNPNDPSLVVVIIGRMNDLSLRPRADRLLFPGESGYEGRLWKRLVSFRFNGQPETSVLIFEKAIHPT